MEILRLASPLREMRKISSKKKTMGKTKRRRRANASFSDSAADTKVCFTFNHDNLSHFHSYDSTYTHK